MTWLVILRHVGFGLGLAALSAAVVRAMIAVRLMDVPDARKAHTSATPKGGGVGIVVAFLVGIVGLYQFAAFARIEDSYFLGVIGAALAIAAVALLDDRFDWPFSVKLLAQLVAAATAIGSGLCLTEVRLPMLGTVSLGWTGVALTLAWVVFATNAMNFIDGLNGLASGVTLVACLFLAWIAVVTGGWFAYAVAGLLAAGVLGFLPFNFPNARIFMGDVGSQFCGFMLAQLAIVASRFDSVELSFLLVPMLLSGVLYDVAFTLCRRTWQGERVTEGHRGHLYQIAHRAGLSAVWVSLIHWGFVVWGGVGCLVFMTVGSEAKPFVPLLVFAPQLVWTWLVRGWAVRAGIERWG